MIFNTKEQKNLAACSLVGGTNFIFDRLVVFWS